MMYFLMIDIFRDFMSLGLVSSYEEFCLLLCGAPELGDFTIEDLEILLLAQNVALDVKAAIYNDQAKIIQQHLRTVETFKG